MLHPRLAARLTVACAVVALLAAGCGDDGDVATDTTTSTVAPTTTDSIPPDSTVPAAASHDVGVYFVAPVGEPAAGGVVDALVASLRTVELEGDATPDMLAEAAFAAVLDGPTELEAETGYGTTVPAATVLGGVTVTDGVATIELSGDFEAPSGAFTDTLRVAQVVFTLTAVDGIDAVRFSIDGVVRDVIGTHGVEVDAENGAVRDDIPEARPPILVEHPAAGAVVGDPLEVSGESNTFEANVRWALTDPDGLILDEGFTTATSGSGTWGTFEFTVPVGPVDRAGLGALILWEDSAEDGRQVNIVEVPVMFDEPT
ncbi:MAG: Gmad2 immunoglobulin-like domain-containing protein [Acidimicrobiales bacterium]